MTEDNTPRDEDGYPVDGNGRPVPLVPGWTIPADKEPKDYIDKGGETK